MSDFIHEGKCVLCGKQDALNEGICGSHDAEVAQAYLFGFADGKASRDLSEFLTPQEKANRARASLEGRGIPVWADTRPTQTPETAPCPEPDALERPEAVRVAVEALEKKLMVIIIDVKRESAAWYNAKDMLKILDALRTHPVPGKAQGVCPNCDGRGQFSDSLPSPTPERCETCQGTGQAKPDALERPPRAKEDYNEYHDLTVLAKDYWALSAYTDTLEAKLKERK
jgi:hypothetical protein